MSASGPEESFRRRLRDERKEAFHEQAPSGSPSGSPASHGGSGERYPRSADQPLHERAVVQVQAGPPRSLQPGRQDLHFGGEAALSPSEGQFPCVGSAAGFIHPAAFFCARRAEQIDASASWAKPPSRRSYRRRKEGVMKTRIGALIAGILFLAATAGAAVIPGPCQFMPRNFPKLCKKAPPPPLPPCPVAPCKPPAPK